MTFSLLFGLEGLLVVANILLWLGPLLKALKTNILNPLHPQFSTPLWVVYFILNTMTQKWFQWYDYKFGLLKTSHYGIINNPDYFIAPLCIVAIAALFYHYGIRRFCNPISDSSSDRILLNKIAQVIPQNNEKPFLLCAFFASAFVLVPHYYIPNAGLGTFWTYPLIMTNAFLPFMIFCVHKPLGILSFGFAILSATLMRSKASFLYPLLPIVFYYLSKNTFLRVRTWVQMSLLLIIALLLLSSRFGTNYKRVLHRDYAFEVFAALVNDVPYDSFGNAGALLGGKTNGPCASWTLEEIKAGIPAVLWPGKRFSENPSKTVSYNFLPRDYTTLPDAYFNRFLLFSGYYDLGIIGAFLSALGFGALYGWFWKKTKAKLISTGYLWPLFLYLPIPTIAAYFVACGGLTYGFINALVPSMLMLFIVHVSRKGQPV